MDNHVILKVPVENLPETLRVAGHHLMRGLTAATDKTLEECVSSIIDGFADLWVVWDGEEIIGAFITSVVEDDDNSQALDVYALGGKHLPAWGKQLSRDMTAYAKRLGVRRIIFFGVKALQRVYENVRVIGERSPGVYQYERVIS